MPEDSIIPGSSSSRRMALQKAATFLSREQFARDEWDAQVYGPQILQEADGTFRMFYVAYTADGLEWGPATAVSADLEHWTKPNVGLIQYPEGSGNTDNNLIIFRSSVPPQTLVPKYDLVDVIEAEGQYVALCMDQATARTQVWSSPDGETWAFVTNAFAGHFTGLAWEYAEPKSIVWTGSAYRIYYAHHGVQRRSIGYYEAPTLSGVYVDQGIRPEFTAVTQEQQYYDIRHFWYAGSLWACVTMYNRTTDVLGPHRLYRSDDAGDTYAQGGMLLLNGRGGSWDEKLISVGKPILIEGVWVMIYAGSPTVHNTWPRQMEMGYATAALNGVVAHVAKVNRARMLGNGRSDPWRGE